MHGVRGVEKPHAVPFHVIAVAHGAERRQQRAQALLADDERLAPEVVSERRETVEEHAHHRRLDPAPRDVVRIDEVHAVLQVLEARLSGRAGRHNLAVDHEALVRQY